MVRAAPALSLAPPTLDQARRSVQVRPPSEVTYCETVTVQWPLTFAHERTVVCANPLAVSWKLIESGETGRPDIGISVGLALPVLAVTLFAHDLAGLGVHGLASVGEHGWGRGGWGAWVCGCAAGPFAGCERPWRGGLGWGVQLLARVMAAVTRWMLWWSRLPRCWRRCTGMSWSARLAAIRKTASSEPVQGRRPVSRA